MSLTTEQRWHANLWSILYFLKALITAKEANIHWVFKMRFLQCDKWGYKLFTYIISFTLLKTLWGRCLHYPDLQMRDLWGNAAGIWARQALSGICSLNISRYISPNVFYNSAHVSSFFLFTISLWHKWYTMVKSRLWWSEAQKDWVISLKSNN